MSATERSEEAHLRRELGSWLALAVTVNAMVGTGIFRLAPTIVRLAGSLELALVAWLVGGLIALCGALCIAELAAALPRAGGIYEFLRRAYGAPVAFWFGWTRLWLLGPSAAGSFARLAAESLGAALGWAPSRLRDTGVACAVLLACTLVNLRRVRIASREQAVLTVIKFGGLVLLALACLFAGPRSAAHEPPPTLGLASWSGFAAALVSVMWAYDGWADMASLAGEARDPGRTLPRAFIAGTLVVTVSYLLVNLGYARLLGTEGVRAATQGTDMVAMRAAEVALGPGGRRALAWLVFTSCLGACTVGVLTGSRVYVSMASDGLLFRRLGRVSPQSGAPTPAVLLTSSLGMLYLSMRSFEQLTSAFVAGMFPFYLLAIVAVLVLRRREPALARAFRTPFYPAVSLTFAIGASALLWGASRDSGPLTLLACAFMLLGLPIGYVTARFSARALSTPRTAKRTRREA